jgi:hypothetical protein
MALEDILKNYESLNRVSGVIQLHSEKGKEADAFESWVNYCAKEGNLSPEQKAGMYNDQDLQVNLVRRGRLIQGELERKTSTLHETMKADYKLVVDALPEKNLLEYAMALPDKDKKYLDVVNAVKEGKLNEAKKAYSDLSDNPVWKDYVDSMNGQVLQYYLNYFISETQRKFMESKLSDKIEKKDKDGKVQKNDKGEIETEYVPNLNKIQSYIKSTLKSYKEGSSELNGAYQTLAEMYHQFKEESKKRNNH